MNHLNYLINLAGAFAALGALWSAPPIREYAVGWLPPSIDDFADEWLGTVLSVLVIVLLVLVAPGLSPGAPPSGPCVLPVVDGGAPPVPGAGRGPASLPTPSPTRSGPSLTGTVVTRDGSGKLEPIPAGTAHVEQNVAEMNGGVFQVGLPDSPQPDTLLGIESPHHLSRFLRLDDRILAQGKPIELAPKRRLLVLPSKGGARNTGDEQISRSIENRLGTKDNELLSDDKLRDELVNRLFAYQENGVLYDPKTIARVGNFHGATDLVFWALIKAGDTFVLECRLVNLTTAKIEHTVNPRFSKDFPVPAAAEVAADFLLAQMAKATILAPKHTAEVARKLSVRGYSVNIPKAWTLWLAVLPEGNDKMFPQRRLASHDDQSFYVPDVYVGPEGTLSEPIRFELDAVVAAPEYSQQIEAYIQKTAQNGMDMNAWDKDGFKILDHIAVVRRK